MPLEQGRIHYVLGGLLVNDDRDVEAVQNTSAGPSSWHPSSTTRG